MIDLLYSDTEEQLRASVRDLLTDRAPWQDVLARTETDQPVNRDLWRRLGALGCAGLAVPEKWGGADASWREAAVVAEELGRAVAPVPFLGHSIAAALLLELGIDDVLAPLAAGERTATLVTGSRRAVLDATTADLLLVADDGALRAIPTDAPGVTVTPVPSLDMTRPLAEVVIEGVVGEEIARGPEVEVAVGHALRIGAVLLAAEQLGLAQRCLELTVEYLKTRRQFGKLIGEFQALKHRTADVWVRTNGVRAVSRYAAACAAEGSSDLVIAAALAQAYASPAAEHAAQECLQLHGGIGFTWELPVHLYLKRAKSAAILLGTADRHRAALGELLDLPEIGAA